MLTKHFKNNSLYTLYCISNDKKAPSKYYFPFDSLLSLSPRRRKSEAQKQFLQLLLFPSLHGYKDSYCTTFDKTTLDFKYVSIATISAQPNCGLNLHLI